MRNIDIDPEQAEKDTLLQLASNMPDIIKLAFLSQLQFYTTQCISDMQAFDEMISGKDADAQAIMVAYIEEKLSVFQHNAVASVLHAFANEANPPD
jgi:hypothetical protein